MKKTSADKRRVRSAGSKWRTGSGYAKQQRTQLWRNSMDPMFQAFWYEIMRKKVPDQARNPSTLRKFLVDLQRKQSNAASGPPTQEVITPDDPCPNSRFIKDAIEKLESMTSDDSIDLPYTVAREPTAREWALPLSLNTKLFSCRYFILLLYLLFLGYQNE